MGLIMRRNIMAAKSGYTAKDYVQDGLVAMWDGIENAGYASDGFEHDPNATVWKDLVGGHDLTISGTHNWTDDNGLFFEVGCKAVGGNAIECVSLECVSLINGSSDVWRAIIESNPVSIILNAGRVKGRLCGLYKSAAHPQMYQSNVTSTPEYVAGTKIFLSCNSINFFKDSIEIPLSSRTSYTAKLKAELAMCNTYSSGFTNYCVRIYDKILSQPEIAANYDIDKARFNLPDVA